MASASQLKCIVNLDEEKAGGAGVEGASIPREAEAGRAVELPPTG